MAHTPGPWKIIGSEVLTSEKDEFGNHQKLLLTGVSLTCGNHPKQQEAKDNIKFIVRACNSHEELLEACKEAITLLTKDLVGLKVDSAQVIAVNFTQTRLEQAIARAEGKE